MSEVRAWSRTHVCNVFGWVRHQCDHPFLVDICFHLMLLFVVNACMCIGQRATSYENREATSFFCIVFDLIAVHSTENTIRYKFSASVAGSIYAVSVLLKCSYLSGAVQASIPFI